MIKEPHPLPLPVPERGEDPTPSPYQRGENARFAWLHGAEIGEGWAALVLAETIQQTERRLAYARREAQHYSSYAAWAERLERELERLKNG